MKNQRFSNQSSAIARKATQTTDTCTTHKLQNIGVNETNIYKISRLAACTRSRAILRRQFKRTAQQVARVQQTTQCSGIASTKTVLLSGQHGEKQASI